MVPFTKKNNDVWSEYTPVEQKQDKKHENDPKETTNVWVKEKN